MDFARGLLFAIPPAIVLWGVIVVIIQRLLA